MESHSRCFGLKRDEIEIWNIGKKAPWRSLRTTSRLRPSWSGEHDLGFTLDGKTVFARDESGGIVRWDLGTGKELAPLRAGKDTPLGGLHTLPDGKTLLTTSVQGWVRLWDLTTGEERPIPGRYWDAAFAHAPDGKIVAVGDRTGRIDLLDAFTGTLVRTLRESGEPVHSLVFSRDGGMLAVMESKARYTVDRVRMVMSRVVVLRALNGNEVGVLGTKEEDDERRKTTLFPLGFTTTNETIQLIVNSSSAGACVLDVDSGKELRRLESRTSRATPSPDGKLLATDIHGEILLLDLATGRAVKRMLVDPVEKAQRRLVGGSVFAWSTNGRMLATTLPEARVCVLDPVTGDETIRFSVFNDDAPDVIKPLIPYILREGHAIWSIALSPDGKQLAASSLNGWYVAVWDTETGKQVARLDHEFQVNSVAFTPDGKSVITFGSTGLGYRWDIEKSHRKEEVTTLRAAQVGHLCHLQRLLTPQAACPSSPVPSRGRTSCGRSSSMLVCPRRHALLARP